MAGELILLVDDEPNITELAKLYLEQEGFRTRSVADGQAALDEVEQRKPALMVLDVMLPKLDGFEVCRKLRAENSPVLILMLTARDDDIDKIVGLEIGADDYLTKPFNPRELVARVKAILRRAQGPKMDGEAITIGDLTIDPGRREVRINEGAVELRAQEFDLLYTLAQHKGMVLQREKLLSLAWGYDYYGQSRTVDVHVAHLRKRIAASAVKIETVTGVGYKLVG
ncbi:MAG: response regulator transcription factor [Anaerolineae bacterium]|nr:MAG: response regulator transcription factor [Anaerolineae bacterium]